MTVALHQRHLAPVSHDEPSVLPGCRGSVTQGNWWSAGAEHALDQDALQEQALSNGANAPPGSAMMRLQSTNSRRKLLSASTALLPETMRLGSHLLEPASVPRLALTSWHDLGDLGAIRCF